ncbi:MAG: hypothetical protein GY953_33380, partial [bacterium]|nr:hypothetical protein [bacterium]
MVYASSRDGTMDLWKCPVEGGEAEQLTGAPHEESFPAWSPDGRSIAFSSDADGGGIFVIPASGGTPAQIAGFGAHPVWSPDGKRLTFDWRGDVYVMAAAGGDPIRIVTGTSSRPYSTWSPDGERLAFWNRTRGDVFVIDTSGGATEPLELVPAGEEVSGLAWARDGQGLMYSRGPFGGIKNLWRVPVSSSGLPAGEPTRLTLSATDDGDCHISPDGKKVAFVVRNFERHLWRVPLDPATGLAAGTARQITSNSRLNYCPTVAPDHRAVVWTSQASGQ